MVSTKRIVCLANSRKLSGRCIAGREYSRDRLGGWVRPVSEREHQEVSEYERQYEDGSDPKLLDVLDIPVLNPCPEGYQQENRLLDPEHYWSKVAEITWENLVPFSENRGALWQNGHCTFNGQNDHIPLTELAKESSSLKLIRVEFLDLHVFAPSEAFGNSKRRVQLAFDLEALAMVFG